MHGPLEFLSLTFYNATDFLLRMEADILCITPENT